MPKKRSEELDSTQIQVIKEMADNKLQSAVVSRKMYRAQANIIYHCKQIKLKTGLDPREFWDMQKLVKLIGYEKEG